MKEYVIFTIIALSSPNDQKPQTTQPDKSNQYVAAFENPTKELAKGLRGTSAGVSYVRLPTEWQKVK